uniref:F-box domain-containing protein n=1 Tax=Davidia involucrata TaxID=16924 RepID=A0A5B7BF76_DAVIN
METRASKRKKLIIQAENELKERTRDRISDLPDGILHHILSFLPIEFIAQTSVLSKRWRFLWRSYPFLDFSTVHPPIHNPPINTKRLHHLQTKAMEFVTTVLSRRDEDSNIKTFRLSGHLSLSCLHDCIRRVVKHSVEELELDVFLSDHFDLPRCLFACDSLKVLVLKPQTPNPKPEIRFPTSHAMVSTGLQSLQTLSLTCIQFRDSPTVVADLFSASCFPLLKTLFLKDCKGIDHLNISCPDLENLELRDLQLNGLDVSSARLEVLQVRKCFKNIRRNESWVKIFAPRLETFYWEYNAITDRCVMENFTSLYTATVYFVTERLSAARLRSAATLFSVLSFARYIYVGSLVVELLSKIDFAGGLPSSFNNLRSLDFHTGLNKRDIPGIACLLRSSPTLHTLNIVIHNYYKTGRDRWNRDLLDSSSFTEEQYWESQIQAFKSFQHCLKVVKIEVCGSKISESEVNLVKFLLKHGRVLQEMILSSNPMGTPLWERTIGSQIMEFPQASANVEISLL